MLKNVDAAYWGLLGSFVCGRGFMFCVCVCVIQRKIGLTIYYIL